MMLAARCPHSPEFTERLLPSVGKSGVMGRRGET